MILMLFLLAAIMSTFAFLSRSALTRPIGVGLLTHTLFSVTQKSRAASCEPLKNAAAVSAVDLASNPLLQKDGLPKFKEIKSDHIVPALEHDLNKLKTSFQGLETKLQSTSHLEKPQDFRDKSIQIDYANVVEQMERIQAPLSYSWSVVGHLMGVKNSEDLRKAHDVMQPSIIEAYQALGQSLSLYRALLSLKDNKAIWSGLEEAQQRIVESALRDMKNAGVALDADKREKFNKLQLEAAELSTKFSNNVLDSTKQFKLKLTKKEEVLGLPESALALAAQNAVQSGESDATAENGPWVVTLDFPSYLPVMQHLKDQAIREQVYRAYVTRASTGEHDNAKLIQRILQVKQEMAALLGYSCHADKSLSRKMASSVDQVMQLIEMLRDKSFDAALRDIQDVKDFAKQQGVEDELQLWDIPFWSERLREAKYEFEEEQLRAFFPLPVVLEGMFKLANRIFGIKIVRKQDGVQTWHEDVQFFDVLDANTNAYIASFFLDPYSRPSEKRGGAWMDVCLGRSKVLNRKPVAYLTCNGSPPVGDKPSLMTFREVETLFHEFGHGLQHMLTNVVHGEAAGINNVEWDAVELPSQFMENWCYDKQTLYSFAKHYQTGEALPEELFQKICAGKNFQAGMQMMRQLFFGAMDMHLHSTAYDPYGPVTPFQVQHELAKKYTVMPPLPEDRFLCSFSHIFAGGYSAGYYSYKWAEVMSADAFAAFEEAGLDNEQAVQKTGRRFRDTVLGMGGGKHPMGVYKAFRGREPSPEALLRHSGLTK